MFFILSASECVLTPSRACAGDVCLVVPSSGREAIQSGVRLYREAIWNRSIQAGRTRMFWSGIPTDRLVAKRIEQGA